MNIWEQREGELSDSYARFLIYRNMGVSRSIDAAYRSTIDATKRNKAQRANGTWTNESAKYNWTERANAWDVYVLAEVGQNVVAKYINSLDLAFQRIIEALSSGEVKPKSWDAIIDSITILGGFIPQETVATIRQNNAGDSVPAIGANPASTNTGNAPTSGA